MTMQRIKTIRSYNGLATWLAGVSDRPTVYLARVQCEEIPSPYAYSPSVRVLNWLGRSVVYFETSHRRFEVFEVPANLLRFKSDQEATDWHIRFCKR
jgi:hypothetical protein